MRRIDGMKSGGFLALGFFALVLSAGVALPVLAQDQPAGPVPVRVRHFEGAVTVQRASAGETSEAIPNLPLDAGDRVWTADGRVELTLSDGTTVWLDQRTTLDIVALEDGRGRSILRLWGGSALVWRPSLSALAELRLDSGENVVLMQEPGLARVDIDDERRLWLSVYDGQASLGAGGLVETLRAGEQSYTELGTAPATAAVFSTAEMDAFGQWQRQRWSASAQTTQYVAQRDYVPEEVQPYAAELDASGSWFYHDDFGSYAWRPTVAVGWSPYQQGRWVWGYGGWTWAASAPWGWATSHYGRWHHLPASGWVWFPGGGYRSAWVNWYVGYGYVGWSPIGYYGRPFISIGLWFGGGYGYGHGYHGRYNYRYPDYGYGNGYGNGGRAVAGKGYVRGGSAGPQGWTMASAGDFGRGNSVRRAVSRSDMPAGAAQNAVTLNGALRQRNVSALQAGRQVPSRSAGTPQRNGVNGGVATPSGGSRAGTAARPPSSVSANGGRTATRPGRATTATTPNGGRAVVSGARPGTTAGGIRPSGVATARPRPGGLSGGLSPTRGVTSRPSSPTGRSVTAPRPTSTSGRPTIGRPSGSAGRPTIGRPSGSAGRPTIGRPPSSASRPTIGRPSSSASRPTIGRPSGSASRPTITPRSLPTRSAIGSRPGTSSRPQITPRSAPGRSSIGRPSGGPRVAAPRGGVSRGSVGRGAAPRGGSGRSRGSASRGSARRR